MPDPLDVGLKISKPFYDANTADGANLIFNSSWPSLTRALQVTYTSIFYGGDTDFSSGTLAIPHNLGFVPFYSIWVVTAALDKSIHNRPSSFDTIDTTTLNKSVSTALKSITVTFYNIDIATTKEYPFQGLANTRTVYNRDVGIKIAKENEDIDSTDMRDFILHSRCQAPQILSVNATMSNGSVSYTDPQGYRAWVFGFMQNSSGSWYGVPYFNQSYPDLTWTQSNGVYTYVLTPAFGDIGASIVVLRDPMFADTDTAVTY